MLCAGQIVAEHVRSRRSRYAQGAAVWLLQPRIVQAIPDAVRAGGVELPRRRKSADAGSAPSRRSAPASFRGVSTVSTAYASKSHSPARPPWFAPLGLIRRYRRRSRAGMRRFAMQDLHAVTSRNDDPAVIRSLLRSAS